MPRYARGFDWDTAVTQLKKRDKALGRWILRIGPVDIDGWRKRFDTTDALARSILFQQLSGKAAATIVGRLEQRLNSKKIDAEALSVISDEAIRSCGVSGNKMLALRDLATKSEQGIVPDARQLSTMSEEQIIAPLTQVRGIGRWTVEMLLMFRLGRPDVLPVDDLGIRKGAQIVDGLEQMHTPRQLLERGEIWGPYRSAAAFYLWRIADTG